MLQTIRFAAPMADMIWGPSGSLRWCGHSGISC